MQEITFYSQNFGLYANSKRHLESEKVILNAFMKFFLVLRIKYSFQYALFTLQVIFCIRCSLYHFIKAKKNIIHAFFNDFRCDTNKRSC
jgi:hypothetical protein